jgi:AcrR family transcriptional regulator
MAVKPQRAYRSPLRAAQARETRSRVVASARELFLEQGYPQTTIAAVAARAGVSPDTIYSTIGSKIALLREVLDVVIGGDDEDVALLDRSGPQAMRAEPDQRRQLTMFATGITEQLERVRPIDDVLRSAAAVDPAAAELRADLQLRQRKSAMQAVVSWVSAHGPLRSGLSSDDAAAIVWTLTSPEVHLLLRDSSGWSRKRYEDWLATTLVESLLPPAPTDGSTRATTA